MKVTTSEWDDLKITKLIDQSRNPFFRFERGEAVAVLPAEVVANGAALADAMNSAGITVVSAAARSQIQALVQGHRGDPEQLYIARGPGPHCGAHVMPDGLVIGKPDVANFVVRFDRQGCR